MHTDQDAYAGVEYKTSDSNPFGCHDFPHPEPAPKLAKDHQIADLACRLKQAAAAHHSHEAALGHPDPDWPTWYATFIVERVDVSPTC